jgi:putative YjhG/YagF family dehydratase
MDTSTISTEEILGDDSLVGSSRLSGLSPRGELPVDGAFLRSQPSGHLFGMTEDAGMGLESQHTGDPQFLILSTMGGMRGEDGKPIALGLHTGHYELGLLVKEAADTFREQGVSPYAAYVTDPCDGRTQGTAGMFDSLPYRNDAAITMRRLIRSLPLSRGVMGIATCDKGLPALMMALAGSPSLPVILVPGGVTLPGEKNSEDLATVQSLGARYAHNMIDLDYAAGMGCRSCGSAGGGCHFLGTAGTAQVVGEALGLSLPHSALAPSGEPIWLDLARRSALALVNLSSQNLTASKLLNAKTIENAMLLHAAFGGSTNLLLHLPAIAHAGGLKRPGVKDWNRINRSTPRLVDVLPNGPKNFPTVQVYMAGGVPEVMLQLRNMGLLHLDVVTAAGISLGEVLDWWQESKRRFAVHQHLKEISGNNAKEIIMDADSARRNGLTSTAIFPTGNIAPQGSVIKATAIDPTVMDNDNVYRHRGPVRLFTSEHEAIAAIKETAGKPVQAGTVLVLIGVGPLGTGMEETYQLTSALKFLPHGKEIPLLTDARFSGVSTGACIGHIGPEALAGGPIAKLRDGDTVEILIDRNTLTGSINLVGDGNGDFSALQAEQILQERDPYQGLAPHEKLPDDTRLWAALQRVSGGTWGGCVYDLEKIVTTLEVGMDQMKTKKCRAE